MKTTNTTIQAGQITCLGCANTAKAAVRKVSGVEDVAVDLTAQTVTVKHAPGLARETLASALTKAGFPAS